MKKIAFVIPTKDRRPELRRLLESFAIQSRRPDQIVIVDSGRPSCRGIDREFANLPVKILRFSPPSAAGQRNAGIDAVSPDFDLVGFLDDDVVLDGRALAMMMEFWESAADEIGGASFNLVNGPPQPSMAWLKYLPLSQRLGFSRNKSGMILPSGFQTIIQYLSQDECVQWFPASASVWRRSLLSKFRFDEWFEGYSYLEDLDFCYRIGRDHKLMIVAKAEYRHFPSPSGRLSSYFFGVREVKNRLYFVRKHHEFSAAKCYLALFLRILISLVSTIQEKKISYIPRIGGNVIALFRSVFGPPS
jgi:glycosyltransferase involved in cell wall biosynthesis